MLRLPLRTGGAPRWGSFPRHRCNTGGPRKPGGPAAPPQPERRAGSGALDEAVAAALRSRPFYEARQERFVRGVAAWLPDGAAGLAPSTVAKLAQYLARHRLREPRLLDAIAAFLLRRAPHLEAKVLQQLVFPFSRLNYRPPNEAQLFPRLEAALARRPPSLATVNVLMSLAQLRRFPPPLLRKVFAPAFQRSAAGSPCGWIMRRYLSLLDAAVALEVPGYEGPRLDPQLRVRMFEGALTADEANAKYSFKGLVAEALRQLLGEGGFRQDAVLPPGYCADFLLGIRPSGERLPLHSPSCLTCTRLAPAETQDCSPPPLELLGSALWQGGKSPLPAPQGCHCGQSKKPFSLNSSAQTSPSLDLSSSSTPSHATRFHHFPDTAQGTGRLLPAGPPAPPRLSSAEGATLRGPWSAAEDVCRVVLSVNDQWHYCQNSDVLVGSRAMRNRHLHLLGYHLIQLPYTELQQARGIEEAKHYLHKRLEGLWS